MKHALTGKNTRRALHAMIALHTATNGRTTSWLRGRMGRRPLPAIDGLSSGSADSQIFPGMDRAARSQLVNEVALQGYCVSPHLLPAALREPIVRFATEAPAEEWNKAGPTSRRVRLDDRAPDAAKLAFDASQLVQLEAIQNLMGDPGLLAFLQEHFGRMPVFDVVSMWWSIASEGPGASEIAQMFHYDLDRVRWLKLFVYLTDVTPETGPHVFVAGSHRPEHFKAELLSRGYMRIPDVDIEAAYGKEQVREICGPAGTMLFADTIGMHKGKVPRLANRLILELQFSASTFGADYPPIPLPAVTTQALGTAVAACPLVYRQLINSRS
jgi:hypothetical protein